jgi:hypothetical protein
VGELGKRLQNPLKVYNGKRPATMCQRAGELMLGQLKILKFSPHSLGRQ